MNKYLLKNIFSFLPLKKELNLIKYNKKLMQNVDISKYTYQKNLFYSIVNPAILQNFSILLNTNNLFDKKAIEKLKIDWRNETTVLFEENNFFTKITELHNFEKIKKSPKIKLPNLIELNLVDLNDLELPCIILLNLKILSLKNMFRVKFLENDKKNISLVNLKKLYIDNISLIDSNLKIKVNNLDFLDLRINQIEDDEDEDEDNESDNEGNEDDEDDNENNEKEDNEDIENNEDNDYKRLQKKYNVKEGFIKTNFLENFIKIFDFNFLSIFEINEEIIENEDILEKFEDIKKILKNPEDLFKEKIINKLNYLNIEIYYRLSEYCGASEYTGVLLSRYTFSKTKGGKYIFKTLYKQFELASDDCEIEFIEKELRCCNEINYKDYYYINNDLETWGYGFGNYEKEELNYNNFNTFKIYDKKGYGTMNEALVLLDYFKAKNKKINVIKLNYLEEKDANKFINNIKKFLGLNYLYISKIIMTNEQLMKLFKNLSQIKSLFSIQINFEKALKLNKEEKGKLTNLFPDISIEKNKKGTSIKWINNNFELKLK